MNRNATQADSQYVSKVKKLIELVDPVDTAKPSVVTYARHFYAVTADLKKRIQSLAQEVKVVSETRANIAVLEDLKKQHKAAVQQLEKEQADRQRLIITIVSQVIALSEGETYYETQTASSRFLGTLLLLTRGKDGNYARYHQRLKPLYKAVLALRLSDKVLADSSIKHSYLSKYAGVLERFTDEVKMREWANFIATPVIAAAIFQDIGLYHEEAVRILYGEDGEDDPFRELDESFRKQLLKINYQQTLTFIRDGVSFIGCEQNKGPHGFLMELMQDTFTGKSGIGDILKIPQVYSSIVLSTKPGYNRSMLPKGYMLIEQMAKQKSVNSRLAEHFINIVGYFPQGFGVCFIPVNEKGQEKDQYEYAIVSRLNPEHPAEPVCKIVSRNLTFFAAGKEERVAKDRNLFFNATKQKLMKIDRARMTEIMSQLKKNFTIADVDEHIPAFWEPHDFFADRKNQSIWR